MWCTCIWFCWVLLTWLHVWFFVLTRWLSIFLFLLCMIHTVLMKVVFWKYLHPVIPPLVPFVGVLIPTINLREFSLESLNNSSELKSILCFYYLFSVICFPLFVISVLFASFIFLSYCFLQIVSISLFPFVFSVECFAFSLFPILLFQLIWFLFIIYIYSGTTTKFNYETT